MNAFKSAVANAGSTNGLAPSLRFAGEQGSTATDNAATPFGLRIFHPEAKPGLVGLDPTIIQDPRFNYVARVGGINEGEKAGKELLNRMPQWPDAGTPITHYRGSSPRFTPDLDDKTVAGDMWAVTLGGHKGTSPHDEADPMFVRLARAIVGNSPEITPAMVHILKQAMLLLRYPDFRQFHPGPGWAPGIKVPGGDQ